MDLEQSTAALEAKNVQLTQENDQLKSMLSLLEENLELKARIQNYNSDMLSDFTARGTNPFNLSQNTFNERQFRRGFQQTSTKAEHRTSSPINFKSFLQSSAVKDTDEAAELQNQQTDSSLWVTAQPRLIGEIVYQLDRRILSHVFQAQKRLYGFTLLNIPEKIVELSTHTLTGRVDEGYQHHLTLRLADLMDKLSQLGYKAALHPLFCEFIVNTYGILKERPGENNTHGTDYNNPDLLRRLIVTTAPTKLHKDLNVMLTCLSFMAAQDRKPLFLW